MLASRSPRRIELLRRIGRDPLVDPADIDETVLPGESATDYVGRLSREKAGVVFSRHPDAVVLGADTCVELDGVIYGQPIDRDDAKRILRILSGRTHNVHTAVSVAISTNEGSSPTPRFTTLIDTARVTFQPLGDEILEWYLDTGEPYGKAGAYAIQGHGGVLVTAVRGLMSSVVGLPLGPTVTLLNGALGLGWR